MLDEVAEMSPLLQAELLHVLRMESTRLEWNPHPN
jgi:transcriptional regulator of aromatic amino acid metabolism